MCFFSGWSSPVFWGSKMDWLDPMEFCSMKSLEIHRVDGGGSISSRELLLGLEVSQPSENGPKVFFSPKWRGLSSNHCFLRGRVKLQGSINTCCIWYFYYIYRYIFYMTVLALRCWDHHLYYQTSRYIKRICRHFLSRHSLLGISGWSADEWFKICGSKMILYIYIYTQLH